jgi:hypothetical protein
MQTAETILEKSEAAIFGRVFANGRPALSPELDRHVLGLTFGEQDKERMHELGVGNQEGARALPRTRKNCTTTSR